MLGLSEVPVQIKELSDLEAMQIALIENLQRENLNPVEEAKGIQRACGILWNDSGGRSKNCRTLPFFRCKTL